MSNKTDIIAALTANSSAKKGARISSTKTYTVHNDGDMSAVLPPQAIKLLEIMMSEEETTWTEVQLHAILEEHTEVSEKQKPWSIFKYYRKRLLDSMFLSVND